MTTTEIKGEEGKIRQKSFEIYIFRVIVSFSIIIFVWSRSQMIVDHFAHYDDLWVPYAFYVIENYDPSFFSEQLARYGGGIGAIFSQWTNDFFNEFPKVFNLFKKALAPIALAKESTYAPLQFYITSFVLDLETSYTRSLLTSRVSSVILSFATLFMFFLFSKNYKENDRVYVSLVGASILTFSWMFLIYSSQSENYAGAMFAVISLFVIFFKNYKRSLSVKQSMWLGIWIVLLCLTSYQVMFFLPGFFIALLYSHDFSIKRFLLSWFICGLVTIVGVFFIYSFFIGDQFVSASATAPGINWNIGPNREYLFDVNNFCSEGGLFACLFEFLSGNIFDVLRSLVSFSDINSPISVIYTSIISFLSLLGLLYIFIDKSKKYRGLVIFILVTVITWILLIYFQFIAFSPTRHSLVLLIPVSILTSFGILVFRSVIPIIYHRFFFYFLSICIVSLNMFYISDFEIQRNKRLDPFQKNDLISLVNTYSVSKIVAYNYTLNLNLYPEINAKFDSTFFSDYFLSPTVFTQRESLDKNQAIMFVSHRSEVNARDVSNKLLPKISNHPNDSYDLVYSYEILSDTEIGFGNLTKNGSNNLFIYIYSPKPLESYDKQHIALSKY